MPTANYPTSLDTTSTQVTPGSTTDLDASGYEHDQVHGAASTALIALETSVKDNFENSVEYQLS